MRRRRAALSARDSGRGKKDQRQEIVQEELDYSGDAPQDRDDKEKKERDVASLPYCPRPARLIIDSNEQQGIELLSSGRNFDITFCRSSETRTERRKRKKKKGVGIKQTSRFLFPADNDRIPSSGLEPKENCRQVSLYTWAF